MRSKFLVLALAVFFTAFAYAQNSENGQGSTPSYVPEKHANKGNVFYADNIIPYFKEKTGVDLFVSYPDFPHYINTGNIDADVQSYKSRVYEWIKQHPDFAKKYNVNI